MIRFFFLLVLLFFPAYSFAQSAYTLQQAVAYAQSHHATVKNAELDIAIQKQKVREITAIGFPQVSADVSFQNFLKIPTTVIPAQAFNPMAPEGEIVAVQFGADYNVNAGITATQLLFDGSYFVGLKAARQLMDLQRLMGNKTRHDIRIQVMQAYYTAAVADENIRILATSLEHLEKLRLETEAIHQEGLIEQQDVEQLTLTVEGMRNNLQRANSMRDLAYNALKLQMGLKQENEITLAQNAQSLLLDTASLVTPEDVNLSATYEKILLERQMALAELNIKYKKNQALPSAGLFFTHQYSAQRFAFDLFEDKPWYPSTVWGFKISIPVFGGGRLAASVQQSRLEIEKLNNARELADQGQQLQFSSAKINLQLAEQNLQTQQRSMELSTAIEQKTLVKYKEGIAGSMELNQAQLQSLSAQGGYVQALLSVFNARCEIEKLMKEPEETSSGNP